MITTAPGACKVVMRRAWCLARDGQRIFGGSVHSYLREALRICWAEYKADPVAKATAEIINHLRATRNRPPVVLTPYLARYAGAVHRRGAWGSAYL